MSAYWTEGSMVRGPAIGSGYLEVVHTRAARRVARALNDAADMAYTAGKKVGGANLRAEVARLRKMRTQAQDILGHTVPKNLSPELAEMWAAAIRLLEG